MKSRSLVLFVLVGAAACVDAAVPAGFAEFDDDRLQVRAVSANGVMFRVRSEENEPEAELSFWREALKKRMLDAGYALVNEGELTMGGKPAYLLELAAPVGIEDYTYLLGITVRGGDILIAEAAGEVTRLAAHRPAILTAFASVR